MFCAAGRYACEPEPCDEMMHYEDRYSEMDVKWISIFVSLYSICCCKYRVRPKVSPRARTSGSAPCSFLLRILTHKRFHSNLALAPTCDTVSTYHITDNARDPQRGLSRATYLLKVSRRAALPNEEES